MIAIEEQIERVTLSGGAAIQLEGVRKQALDVGRSRLLIVGSFLLIFFIAISIRLADIMIISESSERIVFNVSSKIHNPNFRGDIIDRNGVVIATTLPTASLYAEPFKIMNPGEATHKLSMTLSNIDHELLFSKLSGERKFVWLKRKLTPDQHYKINRLGIPGLGFQQEEHRIYPHGALMSHVVGRTDTDGNGIAGVERFFDENLGEIGTAFQLSLDVRVQSLVRDELLLAMDKFSASAAAGIVLDVNSGELLALVSLPEFDPNIPSPAESNFNFSRATKGVYEMGSIFKLFTTAMALDSGVISLEDRYDASEPIRIGGHTISDYHAENRELSVPEILIHSSNIGAAKMALDIGIDRQQHYLSQFGLLDPAKIELPEVGNPLVPKIWSDISSMTISYGHGISVSPLQLASAVGSLINGGFKVEPTLLSIQTSGKDVRYKRVLTADTSNKMRALMRLVVSEGTGRKANAEGYFVGGKTGTANKLVNGKYSRNNRIASFVGAFPMNDPRYVVLVMIDEPEGTEQTLNHATGGWVAAPAVGKIIARMGPMLGVRPVKMVMDDIKKPVGFIRLWERSFETREATR